MNRSLSSFVLALLILVLAAPAALAAPPVHDKFIVDETFPEEVCGIPVTTRLEIRGNVLVFEDRTIDVSTLRITFNNVDGDWLTTMIVGPAFIEEQLNGDILTVNVRLVGVHSKWRSSEGLTAAFDRGQIVFRDVIDLNDPSDPEDDVLVSSDILRQAGPHPEADSGFAVFCEVVNQVLG